MYDDEYGNDGELQKIIYYTFKYNNSSNDYYLWKVSIGDENTFNYLCLNYGVQKNHEVKQSNIKHCTSNKDLGTNVLTEELLDWYQIGIFDNLSSDEIKYYYKNDKKQNDFLNIDDIYWKLEMYTEKQEKNLIGNDFKFYISDDKKLYIDDYANNNSIKIFDKESIKAFTMQKSSGDGGYNIIILTDNNNVYSSEQNILHIISKNAFMTTDITFKKQNISNIESFISTNDSEILAGYKIYAVDYEGNIFLMKM